MHNGSPEREESEKGTDIVFEVILAKNFPNLLRGINLHIHGSQWTPSRTKLKISIPKLILVKS